MYYTYVPVEWLVHYTDSHKDEPGISVLWQWSSHLPRPQVGYIDFLTQHSYILSVLYQHSVFPQPSQMYYCLLEAASEQSGSGTRPDSATETSPLRVDSKRQYVVCFATIGKTGLDLYPFTCHWNFWWAQFDYFSLRSSYIQNRVGQLLYAEYCTPSARWGLHL